MELWHRNFWLYKGRTFLDQQNFTTYIRVFLAFSPQDEGYVFLWNAGVNQPNKRLQNREL
jgi:hypothetical protein